MRTSRYVVMLLVIAGILALGACEEGPGSRGPAGPPGPTGPVASPADDHGDTRSTATRVGLPSSTGGTLTEDDVDYFVVEVSRSGTLTATTRGSTDTLGRLEDSGGGTLAENDDGGSGTNFQLSRAVSPGTYYIRVSGYSGSDGAYTLDVSFTGSRRPADDHGNTRSTATRVVLPSSTGGALTENDVDYFVVQVSRSGTLTAITTGSTDTVGLLENDSGATLAVNDDGGSGRNFQLSRAVSGGTYYITVVGYPGSDGDYTLDVSFTGGSGPASDDHGDTRSTATRVVLPSSTGGALTENDFDYFVVQVSRSGTLTAITTGSTDTVGLLENDSGATLAVNDDGGSGRNFQLSRAVSPGTYYVRVSGYFGIEGNYTLGVSFTGERGPTGDDHGDTPSTATPTGRLGIAESTELLTRRGTLTESDVDYFAVEIRRSGTLTASTSGTTDTIGQLEHAGGATLATNDDGGVNRNFRLSSAVSAGTYYVRVSGYRAASGSYTLELRLAGRSRPPSTSEFDINIWAPPGELSGRLGTAVSYGVRFWESAITGDLPPVRIIRAHGDCPGPSLVGETIDDVTISVRERRIDGAGGTLAQAGPCSVRTGGLPAVGKMIFDTDDVARLNQQQLNDTVVHEIAHVLGFGTLWRDLLRAPSLVNGRPVGGRDTYFAGRRAISAFDSVGGSGYRRSKVPVENDTSEYGAGSLDGHWRESIFGHENMSPSINRDRSNPVSIVTIESFADLGYQVNIGAAQAYRLPGGPRLGGPEGITLVNDILEVPVSVIDRDGKVVAVIGVPSAVSEPSVGYVRAKELE